MNCGNLTYFYAQICLSILKPAPPKCTNPELTESGNIKVQCTHLLPQASCHFTYEPTDRDFQYNVTYHHSSSMVTSCSMIGRPRRQYYCDTNYRFKVTMFSEWKGIQEEPVSSDWTSQINWTSPVIKPGACEEDPVASENAESSLWILVPAVGGSLLVTVVLTALTIICYRRRQERRTAQQKGSTDPETAKKTYSVTEVVCRESQSSNCNVLHDPPPSYDLVTSGKEKDALSDTDALLI